MLFATELSDRIEYRQIRSISNSFTILEIVLTCVAFKPSKNERGSCDQVRFAWSARFIFLRRQTFWEATCSGDKFSWRARKRFLWCKFLLSKRHFCDVQIITLARNISWGDVFRSVLTSEVQTLSCPQEDLFGQIHKLFV